MTTTQRVYRPADAKAQKDIDKAARELSQEAVSDFATRLLNRLRGAPRFQSIGRQKCVYVEDVAAAVERELYSKDGDE